MSLCNLAALLLLVGTCRHYGWHVFPDDLAAVASKGIGWLAIAGLLAEERCNHKGAALRNNPRAAVYVVNVGVESGSQEQGRVRATVGPITVSGL